MSTVAGLTVHRITLRCRPLVDGLSDLYDRLKAVPAEHGETRHMLDSELRAMHAHWKASLRHLAELGCIQLGISHQAEDLPKRIRDRPRIQSAQPAWIGYEARVPGKAR